jgi:predicted ester cyclase
MEPESAPCADTVQRTQVNPQNLPGQNQVPVRMLYEEMFSHGRYELTSQVFHSTCPVHFGTRRIRLDEAVAEGKGWRSAAPNLLMTVDEISENGDMVYVAWTARGTHTGHGHGLRPTGKMVLVKGKSRFRVVNSKIMEAWNEEYRPEVFRQLGVSRPGTFMLLFVLSLWSTIKGVISSLTP